MNPTSGNEAPMTGHPGDDYTHGQLENWFALHLRMARRQLERAASRPDPAQRDVDLAQARAELTEYEAGLAAYRGGQQPHHLLVELGLDPSIEPGLGVDLSGYAAADRAYRVRWSICQDAMRRWGWWVPGDPPTAEMREEEAADLEAEDAWRVSAGLDPMWAEAIAELRS